ncbi:MAG: hypothetical protein IPO22_02610 [Anaerolineales bacterium]|nr:hypothetical protein [Anaerolineales bacterium]
MPTATGTSSVNSADSITDLGGDTTAMAREDAGHFAGTPSAHRDWDDTGEVSIPLAAKCHSANGLPQFVLNGSTVVVDGKTSSSGISVGPQPLPALAHIMYHTA